MNTAEYNQFRQQVDDRRDYAETCHKAAWEAIDKGHSPACKWVEVLQHQSSASESWCDCGKRVR